MTFDVEYIGMIFVIMTIVLLISMFRVLREYERGVAAMGTTNDGTDKLTPACD